MPSSSEISLRLLPNCQKGQYHQVSRAELLYWKVQAEVGADWEVCLFLIPRANLVVHQVAEPELWIDLELLSNFFETGTHSNRPLATKTNSVPFKRLHMLLK